MYDFCINGGGMVGAATALGLASKGCRVAIVEPHMPSPFDRESKPDIRVSAISQTSADLLDALGAWRHIAAMRVKTLHRTECLGKTLTHALTLPQAVLACLNWAIL
ncbi:FAD-dependent monooxygenase [Alteromonas sp. KUL49]|uniref:FAD-dependent monooxygenase n=1 Tax=Alteromonas sp. KUL49 TaxID=2480798 RepID=UPI0010FFC6FA|nr:FAD-dependent monooxygenase [Alteromonas sp. KUL49]GEA11465.1 hypothetical protein KUL49_18400 [Alteromonas sp. KUL49]